jgi:hypothetical protein
MSRTSFPRTFPRTSSVSGPFEHLPRPSAVEPPACPPWCGKDHAPELASGLIPMDDRPTWSIAHTRRIGEGDSAVVVHALTEVHVGSPARDLPARFTYRCPGLSGFGATAEQALELAANIVDAVAIVNSVSHAVSPQLDLMAEFYRDPPTTPLPIQADPEPRPPASFDDPADPTRAEDGRVSRLVQLVTAAVAGSVTQVAITAATSDGWRSLD